MKKIVGLLGSVWGGVITHKLRSFLTMLGIVIGVAAVIILMAVGKGTTQSVVSRISSLGANTLFISPGFHTTTGRCQDSIWQRQYSHSGRCRSDCRKCQ